eukprot:CAMPEP_0171100614 /NCGR_PEP_ID=MMETSP0766_2-20121228/53062_1 /TAXON_ID=439317 /ORGANISM="Gambierdiscus australes, Strain CAWD 149" /LENGTH=60 /DNA_ID=CAMNT_0011560469 /DNA_START=60 /DNA_END=239 /DNA_ORIENTATION=-
MKTPVLFLEQANTEAPGGVSLTDPGYHTSVSGGDTRVMSDQPARLPNWCETAAVLICVCT